MRVPLIKHSRKAVVEVPAVDGMQLVMQAEEFRVNHLLLEQLHWQVT